MQTGRPCLSTAIVTTIGCDANGWRHILGLAVVDSESYGSWKGFLETIRDRGAGRRAARDIRCP
ncbi:MAG: hypothetical protein GX481_03450 [Atopobium sp.]|nr:hypothetical protein [Atopobium sp.]